MAVEAKGCELLWGWLEAAWIIAAIDVGSHLKASLGFCGAGVVENLVGIEWLARPVPRNLREQPMLDGIPFGSTCRVMSHSDGERKGVGELGLDLGFPGIAAPTMAAAGISQNEQLA